MYSSIFFLATVLLFRFDRTYSSRFILFRYTLIVTGEFYMDTDSSGMPVTYRTLNASKIAYNGSLVNTHVNYNGLLPYSFYIVQVNASNRAGYLLSNVVTFPTPPARKYDVKFKMPFLL